MNLQAYQNECQYFNLDIMVVESLLELNIYLNQMQGIGNMQRSSNKIEK